MGAGCTDEPEAVTGCDDCLELLAEDLAEDNDYQGRCLHCRQDVAAKGGVQWRRAVRRACPHCGQRGGNRSRRRFLFLRIPLEQEMIRPRNLEVELNVDKTRLLYLSAHAVCFKLQ